MKKVISFLLVFAVGISLFCSSDAYARRKTDMIEFFDDHYITKAYVEEVTNSSGDRVVDTAAIKENIEQAFRDRKSHKFEVVNSPSEADIIVSMDITEYLFTTEDPVDMLVSPVAIAVDKMKDDHYARMQVDVTITDAKTGEELWQEGIKSTITDATMTEEESYGQSQDRIAKVLIRKLFSKSKRGSRR